MTKLFKKKKKIFSIKPPFILYVDIYYNYVPPN